MKIMFAVVTAYHQPLRSRAPNSSNQQQAKVAQALLASLSDAMADGDLLISQGFGRLKPSRSVGGKIAEYKTGGAGHNESQND